MYTSIPTTLLALTGILGLSTANPITSPQTSQDQHPYFAVTGFSWSKSSTSSRYMFNVSFPESVTVSSTTIPGFADAVPCTGTWFYAPSETSNLTLINACGKVGDGEKATVTSQMDVDRGVLYLTYAYNETEMEERFVYVGEQKGLGTVAPGMAGAFNTSAGGPGVDGA